MLFIECDLRMTGGDAMSADIEFADEYRGAMSAKLAASANAKKYKKAINGIFRILISVPSPVVVFHKIQLQETSKTAINCA